MITCSKCSKENQDHYKFCLGCGAELPRDAAPKPFAPRTPPHGMKAVAAVKPAPAAASPAAPPQSFGQVPNTVPRPVAAPAMAAEPAPVAPTFEVPYSPPVIAAPAAPAASGGADATVGCPQCGHVNSTAFKFCASCGYNLSSVAAAVAMTAPAPAMPAKGAHLTALRADGSEAGTFDITGDTVIVGRELGGIFGGDNYLSPRHATLTRRAGKLVVKDDGSTNGTYIKLKRDVPERLVDGQLFRIGQEIIRFETLHSQPAVDGVEVMGSPSAGYVGCISLVTAREQTGNAFPIPETGVHIGRERGHVLFPEDGYVSGLHCSITKSGDGVVLTDLGSSNGSFLRLLSERELQDGDVLLMGQQLFRVSV